MPQGVGRGVCVCCPEMSWCLMQGQASDQDKAVTEEGMSPCRSMLLILTFITMPVNLFLKRFCGMVYSLLTRLLVDHTDQNKLSGYRQLICTVLIELIA